jgi:cytoskeletal protein RodZ
MPMRLRWGMVAALLVAACSSPVPKTDQPPSDRPALASIAQAPAVTLTAVKWTELESAIAAHKGKVVVLDVWAEY